MKNIHKTHRLKNFSVSEMRLCHMAPPGDVYPDKSKDSLTGKSPDAPLNEVFRSNEHQRQYWKSIETSLNLAIREEGSAKLKEIWKSQELREWIMSQVKRNPVDGRLTWLPPNGQAHAREYERFDETNKKRLVDINEAVSKRVDEFVKTMEDAIADIDDAKDRPGAALPVDPAKLKEILLKMKDKEAIKNRQHALVACARAITNFSDAASVKKKLKATIKENKKLLGPDLVASLETDVTAGILDAAAPPHFDDKQKKMLEKIIELSKFDFEATDRTDIVKAIDTLETSISDFDDAQERVLISAFENQTRYLRSIAGDDRPALARTGIRTDFKYEPDRLIQNVKVLKADLTAAEEAKLRGYVATFTVDGKKAVEAATQLGTGDADIIAEAAKFGFVAADPEALATLIGNTLLDEMMKTGKTAVVTKYKTMFDKVKAKTGITADNICDALVDSWDDSKIDAYMKNDLHLDDRVGYSIKRMMLQARMPKDVSEFLINSDMEIRISDLKALSEIDKTKVVAGNIPEELAKQILKRASETNNAGSEIVDKDRFISMLAFVQLGNAGANEAVDLNAAETAATAVWNAMVVAGDLVDTGDGSAFLLAKEAAVLTRLKATALGARGIDLQNKINAAKLYELTWAEASKKYFGQFIEDTGEFGGEWFEYIKELGALVYSSKDRKIKTLLKERDRLTDIRSALQDAIKATDESNKWVETAIEKVKALKKHADKLSKPLEATASIGASVDQALYLLEANAYVISILRTEDLWDELPNQVRKTSLWIAMNKGGGDADRGILEARKFIRAYHSAPGRIEKYDAASAAYLGAMSDENFDKYKEALRQYWEVSGIDFAVFSAYSVALGQYHDSLKITPASLKGVSVTAKGTKGPHKDKEVTGKVKKILDASDLTKVIVTMKVGGDTVEAVLDYTAYAKEYIEASKSLYEKAAAAFRTAASEINSQDARDPRSDAYNNFLTSYLNGSVFGLEALNPDEETDLLRYLRKTETAMEIQGRDNLSAMFHRHGLFIKPAAVRALSLSRTQPEVAGVRFPEVNTTNGSLSVDRWLNDGHRDFANEPLNIILDGPKNAKDALIKAYVNQTDETYIGKDKAGNPVEITITAQEAFQHVSEIKRRIQWQSEQHHPALEILDEEELFKDPIQGGFRAMVETLQDMWAGDAFDKAQVIAAVVAAVWLVRHIWQEGGKEGASGFMKLAKLSVVGLPLLMVANSAYKNRTGRDILGEKLLFMNKSKRNGILEQWRRRGAKYSPERYGILTHPSGFAAMQELMRKDDPVSIEALHKWRMTVKDDGTGYNNYLHGKPANLDLSDIQWRLGNNASEEEAAKVAFMSYEALCVDVAAMHGQSSGDLRARANWGSDYIYREYHLGDSYKGVASGPGKDADTLQKKIRGAGMGMLDVMLAEARLPSLANSVVMEETTVEQIANFMGRSTEWVKTKLVQGYTKLEIMALKGKEKLPEWWNGAKELTFNTAEEVSLWFRTRGIFASEIMKENFSQMLKAAKRAGLKIIETAPGVIEFVVDGAVDISASVIAKMKETHDYILLHEGIVGELRLVKKFEEFVLSTFGYDFLQELKVNEAKNQITRNIGEGANFYNGGQYSPIDGKGKFTYSQAYRGRRARALTFGEIDRAGNFKSLTQAESKALMDGKLNDLSNKIFSEADYTKLPPSQQRYVFEVLQGNLFRHIAVHPDLAIRMAAYETDLENFQNDLETKQEELRNLYPDIARFNDERRQLKKEIGPLLTRTIPQLTTLFDKTRDDLERETNRVEDLSQRILDINAELATSPPWHRKFLLNQQLSWSKNAKTKHTNSAKESMKRLMELHVHRIMATKLDAAGVPRRDWAKYAATVPDGSFASGAIATINNKVRGPVPINLSKADAIKLRDEAEAKVDKDEQLEQDIKDAHDDAKKLVREIGDLDAKISQLEDFGVSGVNINAQDMYDSVEVTGAPVAAPVEPAEELFSKTRDERAAVLLGQVHDEKGKLLGIPLKTIFGEAGKIADDRIEKWIERRINHDQVYLKSKKLGENVDASQAYERYLAQIGLNEIFMRSMLREEGDGDKYSPLHLSLDEAQDIDRYLEERERLVSFAQFLEVWEGVAAADRPKYLP